MNKLLPLIDHSWKPVAWDETGYDESINCITLISCKCVAALKHISPKVVLLLIVLLSPFHFSAPLPLPLSLLFSCTHIDLVSLKILLMTLNYGFSTVFTPYTYIAVHCFFIK